MTAQASLTSEHPTVPPNALRIARLYTAIKGRDEAATAACYHDKAHFRDIAFRRRGKKEIMEMWRLVFSVGTTVEFDVNTIAADDCTGSGRWTAKYFFDRTANKAGRWVENPTSSSFVFQDGFIFEHNDDCDPMAWARQALGYPICLIVGSVAPLRRGLATLKLWQFLSKEAR
jgi:hypothetical protein